MSPAVTKKEPSWPVVEIFGPTIQGEGVDQGVGAHFVRFGGCDFACDWCDTPYAVIASEVRAGATKMTAKDIVADLSQRDSVPWVILTGGNPALHDLSSLVEALHRCNYLVAVETQGSRWREWMKDVDRLCVSPKGPSAKEPKSANGQLQKFLHEGMEARIEKEYNWLFLKVVCFDEADVDFALLMRSQLSDALLYLSAGNDAGRTVGHPEREDSRQLEEVRRDLLQRLDWLHKAVQARPDLCTHDVFIQCQLHTLLWGNGRGF